MTRAAERGRTSKVIMKNKFIVFFSCALLMFFMGTFNFVQAQWESEVTKGSNIPDFSNQLYEEDQKDKALEANKASSGDTKKTTGKDPAVPGETAATTTDQVKPLGKIDIPENLGLPNNTVAGVLTNLLTWLLGIIGVLGLMGFIISGIQYLLAYANEELAEAAKKNMTFSIIGIVVALSGFIIIQAINLALQGTAWF